MLNGARVGVDSRRVGGVDTRDALALLGLVEDDVHRPDQRRDAAWGR